MKPLFFLLCLALTANHAIAQNLSAGVRSGAGHWIAVNHDGAVLKPTNNIIWEKGLYARFENTKRLAYELQAKNYNFTVPVLPFSNYTSGCNNISTRPVSERTFCRAYEYSLAVQYRLSGRQSKCSNYVGLSLSAAFSQNRYEFVSEDVITLQRYANRGTRGSAQTFYGINHYLSVPVSKRIDIHSATSFQIDPQDILFRLPVNNVDNMFSKFSLNIGCGYSF